MTVSHADLSAANRQLGISSVRQLPSPDWDDRWNRIICAPALKDRLMAYALFCFTGRQSLSAVGLPAHGLAILAGPPGTGKTTLAHGLANEVAKQVVTNGLSDHILFAVVDPHALPSEMLGGSQRAAASLFERGISDLALEGRPVVVLLDEVEALAVNRRTASGATNPVDVHRATDAVLTGLDKVAEQCRNVVMIGTTNDIGGVDDAFLSRADLVEHLGLPTQEAILDILTDALTELSTDQDWDPEHLTALSRECANQAMDARQVRKLVLRALISSGPELAMAPQGLRLTHLSKALAS